MSFHSLQNSLGGISEIPKHYIIARLFRILWTQSDGYVYVYVFEYEYDTYAYIHTYIHLHIYTYIHTYIHTYILTYSLSRLAFHQYDHQKRNHRDPYTRFLMADLRERKREREREREREKEKEKRERECIGMLEGEGCLISLSKQLSLSYQV